MLNKIVPLWHALCRVCEHTKMQTPFPLPPQGAEPLFTRARRQHRLQRFLETFERTALPSLNLPTELASNRGPVPTEFRPGGERPA